MSIRHLANTIVNITILLPRPPLSHTLLLLAPLGGVTMMLTMTGQMVIKMPKIAVAAMPSSKPERVAKIPITTTTAYIPSDSVHDHDELRGVLAPRRSGSHRLLPRAPSVFHHTPVL